VLAHFTVLARFHLGGAGTAAPDRPAEADRPVDRHIPDQV